MTNELEKQFFQCFGIEPKYESHSCDGWGRTVEVKYFTDKKEADKFGIVVSELEYPQITDRILLELICILTKRYDYADQNWLTKCNDIKELKVSVLRLLLLCPTSTIERYKHQVRTLFEDG